MQSTRDLGWNPHDRSLRFALVGLLVGALGACSSPGGADPGSGSPTTKNGGNGGNENNGNAGGAGGGGGSTDPAGAGGGNADPGSGGGGDTDAGGGGGGDTDAGGGATDSGAGDVDAGGGGGGGPSAPYPAGPYGFAEGNTMGNFSFMGYKNGTGAWTTLSTSDYYDPSGSRGVRAVFITLGKVLCGACEQEAQHLPDWKAKYAPFGAKFLSTLHSGASKLPDGSWSATQASVDAWEKKFTVTYDMGIDPKWQLNGGVEPTSDPTGWLVDSRTMKIVKRYGGAPGFLMGMDELLKKNGATGL